MSETKASENRLSAFQDELAKLPGCKPLIDRIMAVRAEGSAEQEKYNAVLCALRKRMREFSNLMLDANAQLHRLLLDLAADDCINDNVGFCMFDWHYGSKEGHWLPLAQIGIYYYNGATYSICDGCLAKIPEPTCYERVKTSPPRKTRMPYNLITLNGDWKDDNPQFKRLVRIDNSFPPEKPVIERYLTKRKIDPREAEFIWTSNPFGG